MTAAILLTMVAVGVLAWSHNKRTVFLIEQMTKMAGIASTMADRIKVLENDLNELRSSNGVKRVDSRASV